MYYKTATAAELRAEYWAERNSLARVTDQARSTRHPAARRKLAAITAAKLRRFDLITAVARQRGIDLLATGTPEGGAA